MTKRIELEKYGNILPCVTRENGMGFCCSIPLWNGAEDMCYTIGNVLMWEDEWQN
jgi:hypothetical protein